MEMRAARRLGVNPGAKPTRVAISEVQLQKHERIWTASMPSSWGQAGPSVAARRSRLRTKPVRTLCFMTSRISELVIDSADPDLLAGSGARSSATSSSAGRDGCIEIGPPDAGFGGLQPTLILSPSSDPRTGKLRLHIDVNAIDRDQDAELERLLALGARPADVGQTGDREMARPGRPGRQRVLPPAHPA